MQPERSMRIFRQCLNGDTANLIQRLFTNQQSRTIRKRKWRPTYRKPPSWHQSVNSVPSLGVSRKRPVLRSNGSGEKNDAACLHHRQLLFFFRTVHFVTQKRACRHMVAIEDRHKLAFACFSALLMLPALACSCGAGNVMHANMSGKMTK